MKNQELAQIFNRIADSLEFQGENFFKISAYRKIARILNDYPKDIRQTWQENQLKEIPGVGEGIAEKIAEYLETGRMKKYQEITRDVPEGIFHLLEIPGLGPKTVRLVYDKLGVRSLEDLKRVITDGSLAKLFGMGDKKVENIEKGIERYLQVSRRFSLGVAFPAAEEIISLLQKKVKRISAAGSLRRMKETIGDIDILSAGKPAVIRDFISLPIVKQVLAAGETKASVLVETNNLQVDLRLVSEECYGAALLYFTGSKDHNIKLRSMAKERGWKINEYGLFEGEKVLAAKEEEDIYRNLGLVYIPPELREDQGEIEAAVKGRLPDLVTLNDIKGDLHIHSEYSDGVNSLQALAEQAQNMGYQYLAVCDHTRTASYAGGLSNEELDRRNSEIDRVNQKFDRFRLLKGIEVEILQDGSLDYPEEVLAKQDFVLAAVHQGFRKDVTERMIKAMQNPFVNAIAHPTGRLISRREGYEVNLQKVMEEAARTKTALELNAYYDRLDLNDGRCREAKEKGVKIVINTDSHNLGMFSYIRLGVGTARRGWLEKKDVLNTLNLKELRNYLKQPEM
ncbi:MAG: DNA polymerase/3'-5' exonuclease PolX [Candidatus Omnitrophota bacterium]